MTTVTIARQPTPRRWGSTDPLPVGNLPLGRGLSRRGLLAAGGAAAAAPLLVGCGSNDDPDPRTGEVDHVTFMNGFAVSARESAALVARELGFFAEVGIECDIEPGQGLSGNLGQLGIQVDFTLVDSAGAFALWVNGIDDSFRFTAAVHQQWPMALLGYADTGIRRPRDLNGRTIGLPAGAIGEVLWPTYAELTPGLDPDTVEVVPTDPATQVGQLVAGQLDAVALFTMAAPAVQRAGQGRAVTVLPWSDTLPDLYGYMLAVPRQLVDDNPGLVSRFTTAYLRGLAHILDHPQQAGQLLHQHYPELSPEVADELAIMDDYTRGGLAGRPLGHIDPDRVARAMALLSQVGQISQDFNPALGDSDHHGGVIAYQHVPGHGNGADQ